MVNRVKESSKYYDHVFSEQYVTADGFAYAFNTFGVDSLPSIMMVSDQPQRVAHRVKPINLYPKDNKKSPIRDSIYLNNLPLSRLVAVSIPLAVLMLIACIAAIVFGIVLKTTILKVLLFASAVILASSSLLLFILHFSF